MVKSQRQTLKTEKLLCSALKLYAHGLPTVVLFEIHGQAGAKEVEEEPL